MLNNDTAMIANHIPAEHLTNEKEIKEIEKMVVGKIKEQTGVDISFLGWLPTDKDLQSTEYLTAVKSLHGEKTERVIHAITKPDHPLVTNLKKVIDNLQRG